MSLRTNDCSGEFRLTRIQKPNRMSLAPTANAADSFDLDPPDDGAPPSLPCDTIGGPNLYRRRGLDRYGDISAACLNPSTRSHS